MFYPRPASPENGWCKVHFPLSAPLDRQQLSMLRLCYKLSHTRAAHMTSSVSYWMAHDDVVEYLDFHQLAGAHDSISKDST
jgi:hypothetical protein